MTQTDYKVEGRQFRTKSDYARALHDKQIMDRLRKETDLQDRQQLEKLKRDLQSGKYKFFTLLEQDFMDEVEEYILDASGKSKKKMDAYVQQELKRQEKRRKFTIAACSLVAAVCIGYLGIYSYFGKKSDDTYDNLSQMMENQQSFTGTPATPVPTAQYNLDEPQAPKEVLEKFKNLLNNYEALIGWVKIDDTNIDYPVMQAADNEYYLTHNIDQQYDRNGSIFMDKDCDVLKPSMNLILYGHHMRSGRMFAGLEKYEKKSYWEKHPYIQFDTIYEEAQWEIMYVFRSKVYSQEEIVFKYYQFIDANGEQEFISNMQEMAALSLYDTGVTAEYGDQLLTLSTCDYEENNGRFVIVAKKVAKE